ncbi:lipase family alpha/beta hydrolase [Roseateles sp. BYS78W]|uniref:Lipase family alpha/beta hydrolase n=1 Tax=Pelomonas candidula TaxID=3299025 RepID=A0ABW7HKX3_9BURK
MARIVLAHGILGFGSVLPMQPINYFNGIKKLYEAGGHNEVFCPSVLPLGSLDARSTSLAGQVLTHWPDDGQKIYLLAHSMGGLDCRRMLARHPEIARRVRRLITVATPHYGSPVADEVLHPGFFLDALNPLNLLSGIFAHDAGALRDLTLHDDLQDEDDRANNIDYRCVGCDAGADPDSFFFSSTAIVGDFEGEPNDGVVGIASSSKTNDPATLLERWDVDHGGAVGWPSGSAEELKRAVEKPPQDHIDRYTRLLGVLLS